MGAVDTARSQQTGEQGLAAEHIQGQVTVVVVVAVELGQLLVAVQRHVGGIHVEDQFVRRRVVLGDELLHEHAVQCHDLRPGRAVLQPAQCR